MSLTEQRRKQLTLWLCCLAQFMIVLDVSVVNVALPSIRRDLGFSAADLQWVVNAYTLTFAGFLLLGGRAADLLGRRPVFVFGLSLFAGASLVGGIAQGSAMLVIARAIQGVGGAIVAPATLSILATTFIAGPERNRALGLWGAMGGLGGATGGIVSGVLTEALSWRWILLINIPVGVVGALVAMRILTKDRRLKLAPRDFDAAGALIVTAGLIVLTFGIVGSEQHGWGSERTLALIGAGLLALLAFVLVEGKVAQVPLMPLRVFRSRSLSGANVVALCLGSAAFSMWYFLSLYLQQVHGFSPIETGLSFAPMTVAIMAFSQIASRLTNTLGAGRVLAAGMGLVAIGMLGLSRVSVDGSYFPDVLVPGLIVAAGIGCAFVPVTIAATAGVAAAESGLASGLINTFRQVGGSLGLALLATIATHRTAALVGGGTQSLDALSQGFGRAFLAGAGFGVAGSIVALLALGTRAARTTAAAAQAAATAARR